MSDDNNETTRIEKYINKIKNRFIEKPYNIFILASIIVLIFIIIVFIFSSHTNLIYDIGVEATGFLVDILLFGILFSLFTTWREQKIKSQNYQEQLSDMLFWDTKEAINKKVQIIKELNQLKVPIIHLQGIYLMDISLRDLNLFRANLYSSVFHNAKLFYTKFEEADLSYSNFNDIRSTKSNFRNGNLTYCRFENATLIGDDLEGANLTHAIIKNANFQRVNLKKANLFDSILSETNLFQSNLMGADLRDSYSNPEKKDRFRLTFFTDVIFDENTDLRGCDLSHALNMTKEQYDIAKKDENTKPPSQFRDENEF